MDKPKLNLLIKARGSDGELLHPGLTDDPMALIAACQQQGWGLTIYQTGHWTVHHSVGDGPDNHAALIDAVFQATVPVADNIVECGCVGQSAGFKEIRHEQDGVDCHGTGYVLARAVDAIEGQDA